MGNLTITAVADPGSHVDTVCMELVQLATITNVRVKCNFNGTELIAKPNDNPFYLSRAFDRRKDGDKFIFSHMGMHEE